MTASQSARFIRITSWSRVMPALLTRMSILPNCAMTALNTALICSSSATSSANGAACPPAAAISPTTSSSFSRLRAAAATYTPDFARRSAQARPIPCEAPVTKATRPDEVIPRLLMIAAMMAAMIAAMIAAMMAAKDYTRMASGRLGALLATGHARGLRPTRHHLIVALIHIHNRAPDDAGFGFRVQMNGQGKWPEVREVLAYPNF